MRLVPLALRRDPLEVLACLADEPRAFLLEVPDPVRPLTLFGCRPHVELRVLGDGRVVRSDGASAPADPLAALAAFAAEADCDAPFPLGGAIGYLAYELGRFAEPGHGAPSPATPDVPLAVLAR